MREQAALTDALLAAAAVMLFLWAVFYGLYRVVVWARRRRKRAYAIGAALAPFFALGNVSDPDFRILLEAKRLKNREDDDPGDPPDSEDDRLDVHVSASAQPVTAGIMTRGPVVVPEPAPPASRPAIVWAISVTLGLAAVSTVLVLSWLLLSDPASLARPARFVRASLSVFEWGALYALSAMLLTSMVLLFRLRKSSLPAFAAYLALGALGSLWLVIAREQTAYFDLRATFFAGLPAATAVLAYMRRLKKRAVLS
jgi:hypothetical protein